MAVLESHSEIGLKNTCLTNVNPWAVTATLPVRISSQRTLCMPELKEV